MRARRPSLAARRRPKRPAWASLFGLLAALASCERPRPEAILAFTGNTLGHMEPCGCSEHETGGLPRRQTYLRQLAAQYESALLLDTGDMAGGTSLQHRLKMEKIAEALARMGYAAVNLGPRDIAFGVDFLRSLAKATRVPLVSANFVPAPGQEADWPCRPYVVRSVRIAGRMKRIGVTGVMTPRAPAAASGLAGLARLEDPARALARVAPRLRAQSDFVILLAQMPAQQAAALAERVGGFDMVLCGSRRDIPARVDRAGTPAFEPGRRGRYVGRVELRLGARGRVQIGELRLEIIDYAFRRSPEMVRLILDYRALVRDMDLIGRQSALAAAPPGGAYVGSEACAACHEEDYAVWRVTRHARAYDELARRRRLEEFDPECVVCHVTGLGFQSGFSGPRRTPRLAAVGCEACHGAGREHAGNPRKPYGRCEEGKCRTCHNAEHSTEFDYKRYWPAVRHGRATRRNKARTAAAR